MLLREPAGHAFLAPHEFMLIDRLLVSFVLKGLMGRQKDRTLHDQFCPAMIVIEIRHISKKNV